MSPQVEGPAGPRNEAPILHPRPFELPEQGVVAAAHEESPAEVPEMPPQAGLVPGRRPQPDAGIRPRAVRIPPPVLRGQYAEIERAAGQAPEVRERAHGAPVVEILEDV